jgi:hypothetical protein
MSLILPGLIIFVGFIWYVVSIISILFEGDLEDFVLNFIGIVIAFFIIYWVLT